MNPLWPWGNIYLASAEISIQVPDSEGPEHVNLELSSWGKKTGPLDDHEHYHIIMMIDKVQWSGLHASLGQKLAIDNRKIRWRMHQKNSKAKRSNQSDTQKHHS